MSIAGVWQSFLIREQDTNMRQLAIQPLANASWECT
jgi:hypothetical protein